jgi:hypothetical protein
VQISSLSTETVLVPVAGVNAGAPIDPTSATVQMAFLPGSGNPSGGDWKTADWETNATTVPPTYSARCLVGPSPGVITLAPGSYVVWVKFTLGSETPVLRAIGSLVVF